MTAPALNPDGPGRWLISGDLDFNTVMTAWDLLRPLLDRENNVTISLHGVARANSAGLGFLLEGLEHARRRGCQLKFSSVPDALLDLAEISSLKPLISKAIDSP